MTFEAPGRQICQEWHLHVNIKKTLQVQGWFEAISAAWAAGVWLRPCVTRAGHELPSGSHFVGALCRLCSPRGWPRPRASSRGCHTGCGPASGEGHWAARSHAWVKRDKECPRFCIETGLFPPIDAITLIIVLSY